MLRGGPKQRSDLGYRSSLKSARETLDADERVPDRAIWGPDASRTVRDGRTRRGENQHELGIFVRFSLDNAATGPGEMGKIAQVPWLPLPSVVAIQLVDRCVNMHPFLPVCHGYMHTSGACLIQRRAWHRHRFEHRDPAEVEWP